MGIEYKVTGVVQLVAVSLIIFFLLADAIPKSYALVAVLFFLVKGIAFALMKRNPMSLLDTIAGVYLLFPILGLFSNIVLNVIVIVFLVQKGVMYLFR